eukprot:scaffold615745_cov48-Prasinocladus_malaysianus.AAC.1
MYVDRDEDLSFADSSFMEVDEMDEDEPCTSFVATSPPALFHPVVANIHDAVVRPSHSRNLSYTSTSTADLLLADHSLLEEE